MDTIRKKKIEKQLPGSIVKRVWFKEYNFEILFNNKTYHLKQMRVNKSTIVTVNSKHYWGLKHGKVNGSSFKTSQETLIDMRGFNTLENKILLFKGQPHKLMKYVNESDLIDISGIDVINDVLIFNQVNLIRLDA